MGATPSPNRAKNHKHVLFSSNWNLFHKILIWINEKNCKDIWTIHLLWMKFVQDWIPLIIIIDIKWVDSPTCSFRSLRVRLVCGIGIQVQNCNFNSNSCRIGIGQNWNSCCWIKHRTRSAELDFQFQFQFHFYCLDE